MSAPTRSEFDKLVRRLNGNNTFEGCSFEAHGGGASPDQGRLGRAFQRLRSAILKRRIGRG